MKLELHRVFVKKLKFGDKTGYADGTLTVNKKELLDLIAEDPLLGKKDRKSTRLNSSHP